jgi:peptide/nickel transport system permease protein
MLTSATTWFQADPMYVLLPSLMIFVTTLSFALLGDAVRTTLDPRAASRLRIGGRTGRRRDRKAAGTDGGTGSANGGAGSAGSGSDVTGDGREAAV